MNKKGKSILKEIEEFLEYLAKADENSRKEENLKKKFGEEKYKAIYNLIGGKYTGGLPKKEKEKKYYVFYINEAGLKYLEEREEKRSQEDKLTAQNFLTLGLIAMTFLQGFVFIGYNFMDLRLRGAPQFANIFVIFVMIIIIGIFIIMKKYSKLF